MKKNNLISLVLASLFVTTIFAAVPTTSDPVAPNYNQQFPDATERDENSSLVGDGGLPLQNIDRGLFYGSELGTNSVTKTKDASGNVVYSDSTTEQTIDRFEERTPSTEYKNAITEYNTADAAYQRIKTDSNASEADVKAAFQAKEERLETARQKAKTENTHNSFKRFEDTMLRDVNPSGSGNSIVNKLFLTEKKDATDADKNATKMYQSGFTYQQTANTRDSFNRSNAGKLIDAYNYVDDMENLVRSKIQTNVIKCYISRELVPAFYCPFPDMTNTTYPDFSTDPDSVFATAVKVRAEEAQKVCDDVCEKERSCVPYNVLSDTNITFSQPVKTIYPTYSSSDALFILDTNDVMQIKDFSVKINITPSATFSGTPEEFETYLTSMSNPIKVKMSVIQRDVNESIPPVLILDKELVNLNSSEIIKHLPVFATGKKYVIQIFKPYIYEKTTEKWKEAPILANIGSISLSEVKGQYSSTDLYFCAHKQLVDTVEECPNGQILDLDNGSSVYHVCTNMDHKIGPDQRNGGFYQADHCAASCVESKKCKVTYRHYADNVSNNQDLIFKAKIGCVDSENGDNQGCTEDLCKAFFADGVTRPNTEIVVQNDNTRVYTVQNKALTNVVRPKINYAEEIDSVATNFEDTFQTEMKDQAYMTMINNQTFDRISYPLGTPSPRKQAYEKEHINSQTYLNVMIKPMSYDIDNETTYNIYSVIKFEQSYKPKYGIFMVDGQILDALTQDVQFKDTTYMIKEAAGTWKVFKQVNFSYVKKAEQKLICKTGAQDADGNNISTTVQYTGQGYSTESCQIQNVVSWNQVPSLTVDRNVFYDATSDTFATYSTSEIAPKYISMEFASDRNYQKFPITDYLERDLDETPGAMIRSQIETQNGASFGRIYAGNFVAIERGWTGNVTLYSFYSPNNLTYDDILTNQLVDSNIVWELANQQKYPNYIKDDTDIRGNNIKSFIMGNQNETTTSLEVTPSFTEEGQRVFKFMFLVDPVNNDPFNGYQLGGSTVVGN